MRLPTPTAAIVIGQAILRAIIILSAAVDFIKKHQMTNHKTRVLMYLSVIVLKKILIKYRSSMETPRLLKVKCKVSQWPYFCPTITWYILSSVVAPTQTSGKLISFR